MAKQKPSDSKVADVAVKALRYASNKKSIKKLTDDNAKLQPELKEFCDDNAEVWDDKNRGVELPHGTDLILLKINTRTSKRLQANALEVIKKNLPTPVVKSLIETVEIVREDRIEGLYNAGKIPDKVMLKLFGLVDTDAFSVSINPKK